MMFCRVWQQTDFRPAADGADCKQTSEQWQSADLRPAERRMSSCLLFLPKGLVFDWLCTHTHTHAHTRTTGDIERRFDLGCTDKDLSPPYTSLPQSAGLSATLCRWQLGTQWLCVYVCVCVSCLICSPTPTTRELHYWGTYVSPLLPAPLPSESQRCVCMCVSCCAL